MCNKGDETLVAIWSRGLCNLDVMAGITAPYQTRTESPQFQVFLQWVTSPYKEAKQVEELLIGSS